MWSEHTLEPTYAIPGAQSFTGLAHQELHDGRRPSSVSSAIIARSFDHFHSPFQQHPEPTIHPSYWAEATPEFEDGPFFCGQNDDIFCYQQAQTLQHHLAPAQDMCTSYDMATDFEADDYYAQPHLSAEPTVSCASYQQLIRPPLPPRTECIVRDPFLPLRNFDMLGPHSDAILIDSKVDASDSRQLLSMRQLVIRSLSLVSLTLALRGQSSTSPVPIPMTVAGTPCALNL